MTHCDVGEAKYNIKINNKSNLSLPTSLIKVHTQFSKSITVNNDNTICVTAIRFKTRKTDPYTYNIHRHKRWDCGMSMRHVEK